MRNGDEGCREVRGDEDADVAKVSYLTIYILRRTNYAQARKSYPIPETDH